MPTARELLAAKKVGGVFTVTADKSVQDACCLMQVQRIGCLVVVDHEHIEGIFSERDVVNRVVAQNRDAAGTRVADVMTRDVIVVTPEHQIEEIQAIMKQQRVRHLPVAGEHGLLGLVSIGDVTAWYAGTHEQALQYLTDYMYGRH